MPILSSLSVACARAFGFGSGDLFAGAALALDFDKTTTLDSRITFTRATSATYFDSSGVLQTASSGAARFDHRLEGGVWVNKGLLIEEQRTNVCLRSEEFNTTWTTNNSTVTANAVTAPDGNTTADEIVDNASNLAHSVFQTITGTAPSQTLTVSVFLKNNDAGWGRIICANGGNQVRAWFNLATGEVGTVENAGTGSGATASIQDVGDGWYRCIVTGKPDTSGSDTSVFIAVNTADAQNAYIGTGESIYVWGAQLEVGAFPTSYIKTTTASVTRNADVAQMTSTNFSSWYNATEGTVFCQSDFIGVNQPASTNNRVWSINDNTANERILLGISEAAVTQGAFRYNIIDGGSTLATIEGSTVAAANQTYKTGVVYKVNDTALIIDGSVIGSDTSLTLPTVNKLDIGYGIVAGVAGGYVNGHIAKFYYWNTRKPNSFLQSITG